MELAESAVAEAAHFLRPEDLFDGSLFGLGAPTTTTQGAGGLDLTAQILRGLVEDRLGSIPVRNKSYRTVLRSDGRVARRMLVGITFPERRVPVEVPGLARRMAQDNAGVLYDRPDDLLVYARPLSFRREYRSDYGTWFNWGVVQFQVRVRVAELRGVVTHELTVDRRFSLRPWATGQEVLKVSSLNLRSMTRQVDAG